MAHVTSVTLPSPAPSNAEAKSGMMREISDFFREFIIGAFDPYRPELHYMRGPGPACHAKRTPQS